MNKIGHIWPCYLVTSIWLFSTIWAIAWTLELP